MTTPDRFSRFFSGKTLWIVLIVTISILVYFPSLNALFTNWDDGMYITDNPFIKSLSWQNIKGMFITPFMGNYHPLCMFSLAIDYQIDKFNPFVFHLINVLIHTANSILVFVIVQALFKKLDLSVIAGLIFGVHSLHVESIAWVSERKDVLYALFFLLSLYSYIRYTYNKKTGWYLGSLLLFILSLLSKGQAVSLAFTLLLVDYLLKRKGSKSRIWIEKIPYFVLALIFGIIAIKAQSGVKATNIMAFSFIQRIAFASYGMTLYIAKLIFPFHLSAFYPYPIIVKGGEIPPGYWLSLIPAIAVVILLFLTYRRSRIAFFGISFFLVNIFLVLQLLPVGSAIMADRYAYIPSIGYCLLFGSIITQKKYLRSPVAGYVIVGVYVLVLGFITFQRTRVWKDSVTLWTDVVEKNSRTVIAWYNLGNAKSGLGDFKGAVAGYDQAIIVDPGYTDAYINRGNAKTNMNDNIGALEDLNSALKIDSTLVNAYINRGMARRQLKDFPGSMADYNKAIQMKPLQPELYLSRGFVKAEMNDVPGAISDFDKAISINPKYVAAYTNRAALKKTMNDLQGAIHDYDLALEAEPSNHDLYNNRGNIKSQMGDREGAILDYTQSLRLNPKDYLAFKNRGVIRYLMKNYPEALSDLSEAVRLNPGSADLLFNRALIKKDMKDRDGAKSDYQQAIKLDPSFSGESYRKAIGLESGMLKQEPYVIYNTQAFNLDIQGKFQDAIVLYRKALSLKPDYPEAWFNLGNTYGKIRNFGEAIDCFSKALTFKKDYYEALAYRGIARATLGKIKEGLNDLTMAINVKPDFAFAYFNRALVYLNTGKKEMACPDLNKAIQLGNSDAFPIYQKECQKK